MNPDQLRARFPHASASFLKNNATIPDSAPRHTLPHSVPQRDQAPALDTADEGEEGRTGRVKVRFVGYRVRPLDPDNFAGSTKDLLDGLRHAGLIPEDTPEVIVLETEQVRVSSFKQERTEIFLTWP